MKRGIKHGGGADLRSPVYSEMGSLGRHRGKGTRFKGSPLRGKRQRKGGFGR